MAHLEGGAFIPEWARNHIGHTVPVDIPKTRALRPKLIAQFLFEKRMKPRRRGLGMPIGAPRRKQPYGSGDQQETDGVRRDSEVHEALVAADGPKVKARIPEPKSWTLRDKNSSRTYPPAIASVTWQSNQPVRERAPTTESRFRMVWLMPASCE